MAYPTEAVYGLGCLPDDEATLQRLLGLKGRSADKGFVLIAASIDQLRPYLAPLSPDMEQRIVASWPGPVTWVLPAAARGSALLCGAHGTIAARVTAHAMAAALCRAAGSPLVSTSANPSGLRPARSPLGVRRYFGDRLDLILHGACGGLARPTPIYDARTGRCLRE